MILLRSSWAAPPVQVYVRAACNRALTWAELYDGNRCLAMTEAIDEAFCPNLQGQPKQDLKDVFAVFDKSGNGSVTRDELREALKVSSNVSKWR